MHGQWTVEWENTNLQWYAGTVCNQITLHTFTYNGYLRYIEISSNIRLKDQELEVESQIVHATKNYIQCAM